jgi:hypothetical protein
MAKRFTDTDKYKKPFLRSLPGAYKLLWDYLYHSCDHAGIWIVDFEIAQIYLGQDMIVNKKDALGYFNNGEERIIEINDGSKWFIPSFIEFQYGELNEKNRAHNSVIHILSKYKLINNKGLIRGLQAYKDKDKDKDMDKDKDKETKNKIPPTLEMVKAFCEERNNNINVEKFMSFYGSKGWMIGKNKMKDWQQAIYTWEHDDKQKSKRIDAHTVK